MIRSRISWAISPVSIPGASTASSFSASRRFCMSAWIASAIPGYWTLTATTRPSSRSVARWTWPIEAAAIGSGSKSENDSRSFSPRSSSITRVMALNDTGSALCWSVARISWNSGRTSSGTSPRSTADSVCPTFIAAPRMPLNSFTSDFALFSCSTARGRAPGLGRAGGGDRSGRRLARRDPGGGPGQLRGPPDPRAPNFIVRLIDEAAR